jgi:hypothetical protein
MTDESKSIDNLPHIGAPVNPASLVNRRAPDFRSIYTNNSKFAITPFDFSFILNEVTESEKGEVYVEQKARITMPPLHAKIFAYVLTQNVMNYEKQFGEIDIPPNLFAIADLPVVPELAPTEESNKK